MKHLVTYEKCGHKSELDSDAVMAAMDARASLDCPQCGKTSKTWKAQSQAWRAR